MRLSENHESWLKFANDYWELDNGKSAVELGKDMIMSHVKKARDSAYGYMGEHDATIAHADNVIEATDRDNLKSTVDSLCDLGELDAVTKALKNVVLGAVQRNNVAKPHPFLGGSAKITAGGNKSPVGFNGVAVKRSPVKSFQDTVDAPSKAFNRIVSDSVNVNLGAKSILKEAIARKADGRLVNPTNAASTINISKNRQPTQERNAVTKFTDDEDSTEGLWSHYAKQEAAGRVKGDTVASKTVEIPVVRLDSFNDTKSRLPFEFRGVNQSETVPVGFNLGATVDVVNPNGSAHGPVEFVGNTTPAVAGKTKNYVGPMGKHNFPMSQPQQFPHQVRKDNIEAGPNIG
jgi:hypothetical protein